MTLTKNDLQEIQKIVNPLANDLREVKKRVKKIEKNIDVMTRLFDAASDLSLPHARKF